jgi:para-aminobenzoate synthetase component 1
LKNESAFSVDDIIGFKEKMLNWVSRFNIFCFLDNHGYSFEEPAFECMLAAGSRRSFSFNDKNGFAELQQFHAANPSWLFGHLGYNAGREAYATEKNPEINFGDGFFFEPQLLIKISARHIFISSEEYDAAKIFDEINIHTTAQITKQESLHVNPVINKQEYIAAIENLQRHIQRGDCYEINFCQQFVAEDAVIDPVKIYQRLSSLSPAPFGAFYKLNDKYCLCASPERFLKKTDSTLISQPIKGTSRRDHLNKEKDEANKQWLLESAKEKSENVMIVDLVRNDLSIVAEKGSVFVKELFGLYSFPQVHQMVSTIQATLAQENTFADALDACFPMGSMTGAPKKRVMELIEQYEINPRGLFSGSIGYITPAGDFDFNVVIRSIFYDEANKYLSFSAGSGITFYCEAESEYDECISKAEAMMKVLEKEQP